MEVTEKTQKENAMKERYADRGKDFAQKISDLAEGKSYELDELAIGWLLAAGHQVERTRPVRSVEVPQPRQEDRMDAGDSILTVWDIACHAAGKAWLSGNDPWQAAFRAGDTTIWELAAAHEHLGSVCRQYGKKSNPDPKVKRGLFLGYTGYAHAFLEAALPEGEGRKTLASLLAHPALLEANTQAWKRYEKSQAELAAL